MKSILLVAVLSLGIRAALLPILPIPKPAVQDEFSYLLAADTFASGRLANTTPQFSEHFEAPQVLVRPTYASKYPPLSALVMAAAQKVFGQPWIGVWLSVGIMCGTTCWALQGWLPPMWAFVGSLVALFQVGIVSYWSESYWGGAWAAIGGALLIGATGRLRQSANRPVAWAFAAGLAILANSRPFEGVLLAVVCSVFLFARIRTLVVPAVVILVPVAAWMGYYNYRVTGHVTRMPYVEHEAQYVIWSPLLWNNQPNQSPTYSSASLRDFWTIADTGEKRFARDHWFAGHLTDLRTMTRFYLGWPMFLCAIAFARPLWRDPTARIVLLMSAAFYAGAAFDARLFPHYVAPATALAYILAGCTLRAIENRYVRWTALGVILLAAALSLPAKRFQFGAIDFHHLNKHASIDDQLSTLPGRHLVLVTYGPKHDLYEELVYNHADLERSKVVWARSLGPNADSYLIQHYGDCRVWLVEDNGSVTLNGYEDQYKRYYNQPLTSTFR